ncbi:hypothetical protein CGZ94_18150 [Enemella evansiae]|uniref:Pyridoxamine 5'-phosphate oxidase N-terminal domain-containing protein n=1 Tax=Enemella evansiae TaxID=2016499 RepID=A0A255G9P6_9ACTN|nr:pyridoxamine 5'-phosphate oxidase family protein [Enemella evansiae]OYO09584.1 hypothetical protein CGZ94_18150 [Enemella evansiae]
MTGLSAAEVAFLRAGGRGALARLATVDGEGGPRVVPVGWTWDDELGVIVLGGRNVPGTARWRHLARHPVAALTIDGVQGDDGWAPWALLVRGRAERDERRGAILLHPERVTSWGLPPAPADH